MVCGRHGHSLWPSWFVAVIVEPLLIDQTVAVLHTALCRFVSNISTLKVNVLMF